jgi:NAD(P)-dependent dehydrogenase (short-subunit alcohol dehydrogenase family)
VYVEKLRLDGKVAMVVGAGGGGHGTASCCALAEAGADIVALDISAESLKDTERRVKALGRRCLALVGDVRKKAEVERMVGAALEEFGALHGLANIVGGMQPGQFKPLLEYSEEMFDDVMHLNLRYAFLTCQAVARSMVERGIPGRIVNVSSVSALPSAPTHAPYGAAKGGLNALTRTMALEWSAHGICVNAVAPGNMLVPRLAKLGSMPGEPEQTYDAAIANPVASSIAPIGRLGTAADIGSAILYLLSDLSAYVTGQVLVVDGGLTVKSVSFGDAVRAVPRAAK